MAFVPQEVLQMENRNMRISAITTITLMVVLALLTFFFTAYRIPDRPPGKEYKFVGAIDFGDNKQGSKQVNTRDRSVADPKPTPPAQSQPQAQTNPVPPAATPPKPITTPAPKPISEPVSTPAKPNPVPSPQPTQPTQPKPATPAPKPSPTPSPAPSQELDPDFNFNSGGGANQGNAEPGSVGNSGTPNTTVLDPNGMYSFGAGSGGGLNGREALNLPYPSYTVQEEGVLTFEFFIEPNGTVGYAKALPNGKPGLAAAGEAAIKKWKFTPAPGAARQKVRVSMTFKLR